LTDFGKYPPLLGRVEYWKMSFGEKYEKEEEKRGKCGGIRRKDKRLRK
jgi:hypothetical protein